MKTYILRDPKTVERQKPAARRPNASPAAPAPAVVPATAPAVETRLVAPVLFIGLDVHKDSIAVSLAPSDATEVRRYGVLGGTHEDVLRLVKKLQAAHPGTELRFAYEAGPTGFALRRFLRAHGATIPALEC